MTGGTVTGPAGHVTKILTRSDLDGRPPPAATQDSNPNQGTSYEKESRWLGNGRDERIA